MISAVYTPSLEQIDARTPELIERLRRWSKINSGTYHLAGLSKMFGELREAFSSLGGEMREVELPPARSIDSRGDAILTPLGKALVVRKRPAAALRVLLVIHYDTVFPADSPFQQTAWVDEETLRGPGVVDAKGGIVVMLAALAALEASPWAAKIGWEVILNSDEEIGSVGSAALLKEAAARNHLGLVFEPAFADGSIVGPRKGSGNYTVVVRGRAAHAGRDFDKGRNAIVALAEIITRVTKSSPVAAGTIVNCGQIEGGGPATNIVPDLAIARFNVRVNEPAEQLQVFTSFEAAAREVRLREGITVALEGGFTSPPKPLDERSKKLLEHILVCGRELGMNLNVVPSGGTCDGNKLAAAGLPVVDSLGPVGGELHNDREYVRVSSIPQRAKMTALLLMKLASGAIAPP
ncbi:MAG: glutamate carboxypeptidase [Phycisphaerales bacterium]|jgi:glutamate carboxypeptidase|nr:glutamate carboxypeptidase [Phycisphaerales bacterium]